MTADATPMRPLTLDDLRDCFAGLVPAVIATASATGIPNVTYLSRAHPVDSERIAVSNQFLSKSSRNLAENPRASLLIVRPETHEEFRLTAVYERTERRGPIFDRLRNDISMIAALTGMQDVFRLSSADIYRVTDIELLAVVEADGRSDQAGHDTGPGPLGELCARLSRCADLDTLVRVTVDGLAELLGYEHSQLLLVDEDASRLFTIASHGYASEGIGAEIAMGEGLVGRSAAQCAPIIVGNFSQMNKYAHTVRRSFQQASNIELPETPMVGLSRPGSQLAVPALALGQLVGVVMAEHTEAERFTNADAAMLTVVASIVASSIETLRAEVRTAGAVALATTTSATPRSSARARSLFDTSQQTAARSWTAAI